MQRAEELNAILSYASNSKIQTVLLGDFNFAVDEEDFVDQNTNKVSKRETRSQQISTKKTNEEKFRQFLEKKYQVGFTNWNIPITIKTMIDVRKSRINDGFLTKQHVLNHGVETPEHKQYQLNLDLSTLNGMYSIIKNTYLRRLRMAQYTDHFPVWATIAIKKAIQDNNHSVQRKLEQDQ